ncbi:hypothetical protein CAL7102_02150 [Dulcicalothrix desertica PCC 7102]|nr:hypothetical protein CAL7102_02150 [Dulcicalothrix desertica PCC 7102]
MLKSNDTKIDKSANSQYPIHEFVFSGSWNQASSLVEQ